MTRATRTRLLLAAGRATAYAVVMALIAALWVRPPLLGWIGCAFGAVHQAFQVASLHEATRPAAAYSVAHQRLSMAWNIALAAVLGAAAFGRVGGMRLVEESSTRAGVLRAAPRT